jgi:chromosome segregation ATPase
MNRSTATIVGLLVCSGLGTPGLIGSSALADETACERLQAALADRDREVAQHRDYSTQIFKQLEAARTELDTAQRANAQAQERANATMLRARKEISEAEMARQKERAARDNELEDARAQIVSLRAAIGKQQGAGAGHAAQLAVLRSQTTKLESELHAAIAKRDEIPAKSKEMDANRGQLATLQKEAAELRAAVADRDARLVEQSKAKDTIDDKTSTQLAALRAQASKLEATLRETTAQRDDLVAKRNAISQQWQEQAERLTAQVDESQKQIFALVSQVKELESARIQIAALKKETANLRAAAAQREARIGAKGREPLAALQSNAKDSETVAAERAAKPSAVEPALQAAAQEDPTEVFDPAKPMTLAKGTIRKWQQPDGSLFFGERPRPGSKLLGEVSRMGTAGGSQIN